MIFSLFFIFPIGDNRFKGIIMFNNKRNPLIEIDGVKIQFIGDVHFGRKFLNTRSSRVGDREALIMKQFNSLLQSDSDIVILVGDLFDKFIVSPSVVLSVYEALVSSFKGKKKTCYIIPGNHDLSRNKTKVSSYKLLTVMLESIPNIVMVYDKPISFSLSDSIDVILDAYNPFYESEGDEMDDSITSLLEELTGTSMTLYVGHWDDPRFNTGYLPNSKVLDKISNLVCVSGHIHVPFSTKYKGKPFHCVGSMQPYSFGEDPDKEYYIKLTTAQLEKILERAEKDKDILKALKNKYIRLHCRKDYILPSKIDCLSVTYFNTNPSSKEEVKALEKSFDFASLFLDSLQEKGINEDIISKIKSSLDDPDYEFAL